MDLDDFLIDYDETMLDEWECEAYFLTEFGEEIELSDCD